MSSRRSLRSPAVRTAGVVVALGALLAPLASAQEPDELEDQLDDVEQQLEDARQQTAEVQQQVGSAQSQLAEADSRLLALQAQLTAREAELAEATATYEEASTRARAAAEDLAEMTARLEASRETLADNQDRFDDRVAATYKYGGTLGLTQALFQAQDFSDFVQTGYYVRSVLDDDKSLVDEITAQTRAIADQRAEADAIADRLAAREATAERARVEVERATEVQRELTQMVASERQQREATLNRLESDLVTYTQLVAAYEAESARIEEELANSRWRAGAPGAGELLWPTNGQAGSGFGYRTHPIFGSQRMHTGVDISGPTGQDIVAAAEGLVVNAGWRGGYGLAVVIDHGGGVATLYAHQSRVHVSDGEVVTAGQKIGEIGSTGQSTGPHLHYEVRENGRPVDPMGYY